MISLEKWMILTPLQKLPNNVGNLGKLSVATSFEWLPKVQKIAQSGHTEGITPFNQGTLASKVHCTYKIQLYNISKAKIRTVSNFKKINL